MADRDTILAAIPQDRGGEKPASRVPTKTAPKSSLWAEFVTMLEFHRGEVDTLETLKEFAAVVDEDARKWFAPTATELWNAEAGVTLCDAAIAETGSLLILNKPGRSRLHSLVPPIHIALVQPSQIVSSLDEGLALLGARSAALVTGPSRTADVEGVIVMGVHGPKRLIVVPIPAETPE